MLPLFPFKTGWSQINAEQISVSLLLFWLWDASHLCLCHLLFVLPKQTIKSIYRPCQGTHYHYFSASASTSTYWLWKHWRNRIRMRMRMPMRIPNRMPQNPCVWRAESGFLVFFFRWFTLIRSQTVSYIGQEMKKIHVWSSINAIDTLCWIGDAALCIMRFLTPAFGPFETMAKKNFCRLVVCVCMCVCVIKIFHANTYALPHRIILDSFENFRSAFIYWSRSFECVISILWLINAQQWQ